MSQKSLPRKAPASAGALAFSVFSALLLFLSVAAALLIVHWHLPCLVDSDDASELILGRLLAEEGGLMSRNWYYSTELRVLNTNLFYALFFHFTDNWHAVRILSNSCMYLLLLAVYYGMSRAYGFSKVFLLSAAALFLPVSKDYFSFVLKAAYYLPHITITFFTLTLAELSVRETGRKGTFALLTLSFVLSILAGMGGPRQIVILYAPLLFAAGVLFFAENEGSESGKYFRFALLNFAGSFIGYEINTKLLSSIYHFMVWEDICFTGLHFSRLADLLNGFLFSYGYSTGSVVSLALFRNILCLLWLLLTVGAVCYALRSRRRVSRPFYRLAVFSAFAFLFFVILFLFTDMDYLDRYNLPIIILSVPLLAACLGQSRWQERQQKAVFSVLVALTGLCSLFFYRDLTKKDETRELRNISELLTAQEYENGYATFWNANVLTELSNGEIEVWTWAIDSDNRALLDIYDINHTVNWLQLTRHDTTHPEGKVFLLFSAEEYENNNWREHLAENRILFRSDAYVLVGYDSYEQLAAEWHLS